MKIINPYEKQGVWLRGSFHIHTTHSGCGWHSIDEVALAYRDYDFLAISDHDLITDVGDRFRNKTVFKAIEVSSSACHMLLVNPPENLMDDYSSEFSIQNYQRLSDATLKNGGVSIMNHPDRYFGQYWEIENMLALEGVTGLEIYSGDGIHVEEDVAFDKWDELLLAGKKLWGFGNDDFHHWGQERRVWNVVLSEKNTHEAILRAIKDGSFYVSTGFGFEDIRSEGSLIKVSLKRNALFDRMYKYVTLFGAGGKVLYEKTGKINSIEYEITGDEGYIRVAAYAEGGYSAFSQPIFVQKP